MPHHDLAPTPVHTTRFSSRDPAQISDFIATTYAGNRSQLTTVPDRSAAFTATTATTADLVATLISSSISLRSHTDPLNSYLFFTVRQGQAHITGGGHDIRVGAGDVGMCPLGIPLVTEADGMQLRSAHLPAGYLEAVAQEVTGPAAGPFTFLATSPVSAAMGQYWHGVLGLTAGAALSQESPLTHPLLAEQMSRTLALAALHVFANTTMTTGHLRGPGEVAPAGLRRAVEHLQDHAHQPVMLAQVAEAAGTSARALQGAFTRHYGISPMTYLTHVRLQRAHEELRHADPLPHQAGDAFVAAVAARWGFAHAGRFSAAYQRAFGVPPEETLRD